MNGGCGTPRTIDEQNVYSKRRPRARSMACVPPVASGSSSQSASVIVSSLAAIFSSFESGSASTACVAGCVTQVPTVTTVTTVADPRLPRPSLASPRTSQHSKACCCSSTTSCPW
eukprot:scaffold76798_cov70-Phaeocystis_antarctica.AAC.1